MTGSSHDSLVVVKVGGSLFDWPGLGERLVRYLDTRTEDRVLLIVGGGSVTDQIRAFDRVHGLGDVVAHRLAIESMNLTARMLAAPLPEARVIERLEDVWGVGRLAVLAPSLAVEAIDRTSNEPMPASWDVTSDSIAARVASHLEARCLVLVKSAGLPAKSTRRDAIELGLVDPLFETFARGISRVAYVNLRDHEGPIEVPLD